MRFVYIFILIAILTFIVTESVLVSIINGLFTSWRDELFGSDSEGLV